MSKIHAINVSALQDFVHLKNQKIKLHSDEIEVVYFCDSRDSTCISIKPIAWVNVVDSALREFDVDLVENNYFSVIKLMNQI